MFRREDLLHPFFTPTPSELYSMSFDEFDTAVPAATGDRIGPRRRRAILMHVLDLLDFCTDDDRPPQVID